jgi:hypothetical protein
MHNALLSSREDETQSESRVHQCVGYGVNRAREQMKRENTERKRG